MADEERLMVPNWLTDVAATRSGYDLEAPGAGPAQDAFHAEEARLMTLLKSRWRCCPGGPGCSRSCCSSCRPSSCCCCSG